MPRLRRTLESVNPRERAAHDRERERDALARYGEGGKLCHLTQDAPRYSISAERREGSGMYDRLRKLRLNSIAPDHVGAYSYCCMLSADNFCASPDNR